MGQGEIRMEEDSNCNKISVIFKPSICIKQRKHLMFQGWDCRLFKLHGNNTDKLSYWRWSSDFMGKISCSSWHITICMQVCVLYNNSHAEVLCYKSSWEPGGVVNTHPSPPSGRLRSPFIYNKVKSFCCFLVDSKKNGTAWYTFIFSGLHFKRWQVGCPV